MGNGNEEDRPLEKPNYRDCFVMSLLIFFRLSSWVETLLLFGKLFSNRGKFCKLDCWFWEVKGRFLRKSIVIVFIAPLAEVSFKEFVLIPLGLSKNLVRWAFLSLILQNEKTGSEKPSDTLWRYTVAKPSYCFSYPLYIRLIWEAFQQYNFSLACGLMSQQGEAW